MIDEPIANPALEAFLREESQRGRASGTLVNQLRDIHRLEGKLTAIRGQISSARTRLARFRTATEEARSERAHILAEAETDAENIRKMAADQLAEADTKNRQADQLISEAVAEAGRIVAEARAEAERIGCDDR